MQFDRILLVLDPDQDNKLTIDKVSLVAKRYKASVEVAIFVYSHPLAASYMFDSQGQKEAQEGYLASRRQLGQKYVTKLQGAGIQSSLHVEWAKHAHTAIVERAEGGQFDLIVKSTRKHKMLDRALMTHCDWHLIRETPIPLLFIRDNEWSGHVNVAAAVDPMHTEQKSFALDDKILAAARDMACRLPAELYVIHAFEPLATGVIVEFDSIIANYDDYRKAVRDKHKEALDQLLADKVDKSVEVYFEEGAPETIVPEVTAREAIDIIVLGAVSRSGLERIMIGSTAERLLDNLSCDMLILRSDSDLRMIDCERDDG